MAGDPDAIAIDDPGADGGLDRGTRVLDELIEVRVVGSFGSPTIGKAARSMIAQPERSSAGGSRRGA
jgi:hypothetical protein